MIRALLSIHHLSVIRYALFTCAVVYAVQFGLALFVMAGLQ